MNSMEKPAVFVRTDVADLLATAAASPGEDLAAMGHERARALSHAMIEILDRPVTRVARNFDLSCPGPRGPIPIRIFDSREARAGPVPLIVLCHGGGWVFGDLEVYAPLGSALAAQLDLPVAIVGYGLAPENPWPAAHEDCEAATRWLATPSNVPELSVSGIALFGDSAGGTLAITTSLALIRTPTPVQLLAQCLAYPAADMGQHYPSMDEFGEGYLLRAQLLNWFETCYRPDYRDWRASPMRANLAGLPPTLVIAAGCDPLRDQARAFASACVKAGVTTRYHEVPGMVHGFLKMRNVLPSTGSDLQQFSTWFRDLIDAAAMQP